MILMGVFGKTSLVVIFLLFLPEMVYVQRCQESVQTVKKISSCPDNKKKWEEASSSKDCTKVKQSCCSSRDFQYHCVPNVFGNESLEVCAPKTRTIYCLKFDEFGARLVYNFDLRCSNETTECEQFHFSNKLYEVPQCIMKIEKSESHKSRSNDSTTYHLHEGPKLSYLNQHQQSGAVVNTKHWYFDEKQKNRFKENSALLVITAFTSILMIMLVYVIWKTNSLYSLLKPSTVIPPDETEKSVSQNREINKECEVHLSLWMVGNTHEGINVYADKQRNINAETLDDLIEPNITTINFMYDIRK